MRSWQTFRSVEL